MISLTGEYYHQVDAKNRIRIPTKLKGAAESLYFARGLEKCIYVFHKEEMEKVLEELSQVSIFDAEGQKSVRAFTKHVVQVDSDPQGRMIIPQRLKEYAKINKDVVITGTSSHMEIWAEEIYDDYSEDENDNYAALMSGLKDLKAK